MKLSEVKGKVELLGFPANKEINPGVASSGKRLRTGRWMLAKLLGLRQFIVRTWTRLAILRNIGEELRIIA